MELCRIPIAMNKSKIEHQITALVIISAIAWIALATIQNVNLSNLVDFFKLIPTVISIDVFIVIIFTKWLWKYPIFKDWLVPFPDLNGTWLGSINSDYIDPETQQRKAPIPVMFTIRQNYSSINCIMHTNEMKSYLISEGFNVNKDKQIKQLSYIYTSKPGILITDRSPQHDGAIIFDIIEKPEKKLVGRYWTDRKTKGEIILTLHSKEILEELPEGINLI